MTTTENVSLTAKQARALTKQIHDGLVSAEVAMDKIIAGEGWLVMGFDTFTAWFDDNFSDITLAVELRTKVIYRMLDEGKTEEEIGASIKGVSPNTAEKVAQQKRNGVPSNKATVRNKRKSRGPATHRIIQFKVPVEDFTSYQEIAVFLNRTVDDIAAEGTANYFTTLAAAIPKSA
jgi:hypothetical protein